MVYGEALVTIREGWEEKMTKKLIEESTCLLMIHESHSCESYTCPGNGLI